MVGAVGIDDPEIRMPLVGHDVVELPHIDDALPVGRDLRIGGQLEVKDIVDGQRFCWVAGPGYPAPEENGGDHQDSLHTDARHELPPTWREADNKGRDT